MPDHPNADSMREGEHCPHWWNVPLGAPSACCYCGDDSDEYGKCPAHIDGSGVIS